MDKNYSASFEVKEVSANNISEFVEKIKEISVEGNEVTNIAAVVLTVKLL